jgi:REP element-mobilizing transposase RayT
VPVYGYCLTSNHVHLVVHADRAEAVSGLMHLARERQPSSITCARDILVRCGNIPINAR